MSLRHTGFCTALATVVLSGLPGTALSGSAPACEGLTPHFDLCAEGTPWAAGRWLSEGDTDTLFLGEVSFVGHEGFLGQGERRSLKGALDRVLAQSDDRDPRTEILRDRLRTPHLRIQRSIDTIRPDGYPAFTRVTMMAEGRGQRIELTVEAPIQTPLAAVEQQSRDYAALVRPAAPRTEE